MILYHDGLNLTNLKKNLTWPASSISLMKNSSAPPINHLNSITILMILIKICDHFAHFATRNRERGKSKMMHHRSEMKRTSNNFSKIGSEMLWVNI